MKKSLLSNVKVNKRFSLTKIINQRPALKTQLNTIISNLLKNDNVYPVWKDKFLKEHNASTDFYTEFLRVITSVLKDEEFVVYIPKGVYHNPNNPELAIGPAISLPNKHEALLFYNHKPYVITEADAMKEKSKNIMFIGINKVNNPILSRVEGYSVGVTFDKWQHYAKVERLRLASDFTLDSPSGCSRDNLVECNWNTLYRWYSDWKFKELAKITCPDESATFHYSHYRIFVIIESSAYIRNFKAFQKHWPSDSAWKQKY